VINHAYSAVGEYRVSLNVTKYGLWNTTAATIIVTFVTDLNRNGQVNILDIFIITKAYGSKPGDENWNTIADLNKDNIINILDVFAVAWDFGKTVPPPLPAARASLLGASQSLQIPLVSC
jgi:hypothetical protein